MGNWAWEKKGWPTFSYDEKLVRKVNISFNQAVGTLNAKIANTLLPDHDSEETWARIITTELINSSRIEGVILEQNRTYNSVRHVLGLSHERSISTEYAQQIGKLFTNVYREYSDPLSEESLNEWNRVVLEGNKHWQIVSGMYRHDDVYVVSGAEGRGKVAYQAPPAETLLRQMPQFIDWFNGKDYSLNSEASPIVRAAIAHHWFVMLHPYQDGNGRLGRALMVKSLSQDMSCPIPISLSEGIWDNQSRYYKAIADCNRSNDLTPFIDFFCEVCLYAANAMSNNIDAIQQKSAFFYRHGSALNARQTKVINRLFEAEPAGFEGGLSAKNYVQIVGHTAASTITRDLQKLVDIGILFRTGERKSTRYYLNMPYRAIDSVN